MTSGDRGQPVQGLAGLDIVSQKQRIRQAMLPNRSMNLFGNILPSRFTAFPALARPLRKRLSTRNNPSDFRAKASMPRIYQSLESEKYLLETLQQDQKYTRQRARNAASQAFTNMIIIMLTIAAAFFIIKTMPDWLPMAETMFHQLTNYKYA